MKLQTNLVRRSSRFYYRGRVPGDLKNHYGRSEFLISLKTADKRLADHALVQVKSKLYKEFAKLRGEALTHPSINTNFTKRPSQPEAVPKVSRPTIENLIDYWASQSQKQPIVHILDSAPNRHNKGSTILKTLAP